MRMRVLMKRRCVPFIKDSFLFTDKSEDVVAKQSSCQIRDYIVAYASTALA